MKKLIFVIITIFTISSDLFAWEACKARELRINISGGCPNSSYPKNKCFLYPQDETKAPYNKYIGKTPYMHSYSVSGDNPNRDKICKNAVNGEAILGFENENDMNFFCTVEQDGTFDCHGNPDPKSQKSRCDEIFEKDGIYHVCDPNSNESRPEPDMELLQDPETGELTMGCKNGKQYGSQTIIGSNANGTEFISYTDRTCTTPSSNSGTGNGNSGSGTQISTAPSSGSSYTTNSNNTVSWTGSNGNSYTYNSSTNTLTETTPNGSSSFHSVSSGFKPGDSFTPNGQGSSGTGNGGDTGTGGTGNGGDTGTGGTGNGGTGNGGDTGTDEPVDKEPAAKSCNDSTMTLQEKMLCEMNAGIKKLNSESTPSNSLNQLMKDLNNKSTQNNDSLDTLKNNTNVTNQNLQSTNTKLDSLNTATNTTNTKLDNLNTTIGNLNSTLKDIEKNTKSTSTSLGGSSVIVGGGSNGGTGNNGSTGEDGEGGNGTLDKINNNLQDEDGKSHLSKIYDSLTSTPGDSDISSHSSNINSKVSNALDDTFSKYSNILGFGSTYASRPANITVTLFGVDYTILDFSYLDNYVSIIRALFLTLAYLYGFMNLLRGSK